MLKQEVSMAEFDEKPVSKDPFAEAKEKANRAMIKDFARMMGSGGLTILVALTIVEKIRAYQKAHPSPTAQQKFDKLLSQSTINATNATKAEKINAKLEAQGTEIGGHIQKLQKEVALSKSELDSYKQVHYLEIEKSTVGSKAYKKKVEDPGFMERYNKYTEKKALLDKQKANLKKIKETRAVVQKILDDSVATNKALESKVTELINTEEKKEAIIQAATIEDKKAKEKLTSSNKSDVTPKPDNEALDYSAEDDAKRLEEVNSKLSKPQEAPANGLKNSADQANKLIANTVDRQLNKPKLNVDEKLNKQFDSCEKVSQDLEKRVVNLKLRNKQKIDNLNSANNNNTVAIEMGKMNEKFEADCLQAQEKISGLKTSAGNKIKSAKEQLDAVEILKPDSSATGAMDTWKALKETIEKSTETLKLGALTELDEARKEQQKLARTVQAIEMGNQREEVLDENDNTLGILFNQDYKDEDKDEDEDKDKYKDEDEDKKDHIDGILSGSQEELSRAEEVSNEVTKDNKSSSGLSPAPAVTPAPPAPTPTKPFNKI